jgi:hypothetical protein
MTAAPSLARFGQLPLGLEVAPPVVVVEESPPARRFRYRIRPTRAGSAALPPVAVAAFDPASVHYVTRVTPSVPLGVVDVPRFDPAEIAYPVPTPAAPTRSAERAPRWPVVFAGILGMLPVCASLVAVLRRRRNDAARRLLRRGRALDPQGVPAGSSRLIGDALAEYLQAASGRPHGALTPAEARCSIEQATGDPRLAERAGALIDACDRARYSSDTPAGAELVGEALALFRRIAEAKGLRRRLKGGHSGVIRKTSERQP